MLTRKTSLVKEKERRKEIETGVLHLMMLVTELWYISSAFFLSPKNGNLMPPVRDVMSFSSSLMHAREGKWATERKE